MPTCFRAPWRTWFPTPSSTARTGRLSAFRRAPGKSTSPSRWPTTDTAFPRRIWGAYSISFTAFRACRTRMCQAPVSAWRWFARSRNFIAAPFLSGAKSTRVPPSPCGFPAMRPARSHHMSNQSHILIADDERSIRLMLETGLTLNGFRVTSARNGREALEAAKAGKFDAVLSDIYMPDLGGLELVDALRAVDPHLPIVLMTAQGSLQVAVEAVTRGASDFIGKPFDISAVVDLLRRLLEARREADAVPAAGPDLPLAQAGLVGRSAPMIVVYKLIAQAARTEATVLILGESGTGKELVARAIHDFSSRRSRPFLSVTCSGLTDTLLEAELFGHTRGAFTGATGERAGLFEAADGGTLFLDELASTSPAFQQSLLRVLQSGEVRRVGSTQSRRMNVRVIGASNAPLRELVASGSFRADLYYRLSVLSIDLPPLRDRTGDVELLTSHFLKTFRDPAGPPLHLSREAAEALVEGRAERGGQADERKVREQGHRQVGRHVPLLLVSGDAARLAEHRHRKEHDGARYDDKPRGDLREERKRPGPPVRVQLLLESRHERRRHRPLREQAPEEVREDEGRRERRHDPSRPEYRQRKRVAEQPEDPRDDRQQRDDPDVLEAFRHADSAGLGPSQHHLGAFDGDFGDLGPGLREVIRHRIREQELLQEPFPGIGDPLQGAASYVEHVRNELKRPPDLHEAPGGLDDEDPGEAVFIV